MAEEAAKLEPLKEDHGHQIEERRDWEKMLVAMQPMAEQFTAAYVQKAKIEADALSENTRLVEARHVAQSRNGVIGVVFIGSVVSGLAIYAICSGNPGLAEKIVFGLFAFVGGFSARR